MVKMDDNIIQEICFDEHLFDTQKCYNMGYCKDVNAVLDELKETIKDLTNDDVLTFLSSPNVLASRLEEKDWQEFSAYVQSLPPSVGNSLKFSFDKGEKIKALHKKLPQPSGFFFKVNTCEIVDGECRFNEDLLRERCTISGPPALLALWDKANDIAKALTRLQANIKQFNPNMNIVESPLSVGLIRSTDSRSFVADVDRLRDLL